MKIGILALQGDFDKHRLILEELDLESSMVRDPSDLNHVSGLIIPGGESTTMTKLMDRAGFYEYITPFANTNPVLGTCAGLIMMSSQAKDKRIKTLGLPDVNVERNACGRQIHSICVPLNVDINGNSQPTEATFIRAPKIVWCGPNVNVLATFNDSPCAVQSG
ncbi:MAG TPA: pyridoxal 5'-phosphate synthase glutaminase subunit PdxT, partial [Candidatus Marinimicrobia bacterium]|nr:pyridoxal 5'-phosphate synthase glutaminase subunit PdxT [Candidatus Neomarinimicrobiota bacterium]